MKLHISSALGGLAIGAGLMLTVSAPAQIVTAPTLLMPAFTGNVVTVPILTYQAPVMTPAAAAPQATPISTRPARRGGPQVTPVIAPSVPTYQLASAAVPIATVPSLAYAGAHPAIADMPTLAYPSTLHGAAALPATPGVSPVPIATLGAPTGAPSPVAVPIMAEHRMLETATPIVVSNAFTATATGPDGTVTTVPVAGFGELRAPSEPPAGAVILAGGPIAVYQTVSGQFAPVQTTEHKAEK